jgi:hypothetical protein
MQGITPLELSEIPAGERHGIVDHDDQVFLTAGVPTAAGSRKRGVVEADHYPAPREAVAVQVAGHPHSTTPGCACSGVSSAH